MPRKHLWVRSALALGTAAALAAAFAQQGNAQAARVTGQAAGATVRAADAGDQASDFIVRCFFNNNIQPQDPIEAPGSTSAEHLHAFFGNMAGGGTGGDNTPFPSMQSGDAGTTGTAATLEQNQRSPTTNCQDTKDTASYWIPAPYMVDSSNNTTPWEANNGCSNTCHATGQNENFHMRVYYIPNGNQIPQEIPDGTIMIAGFPTGCATVPPNPTPDTCANPPTRNYPVDPQIIDYACGANSGADLDTPMSAWPYNCNNYVNKDADDNYSDGEVAIVRFPYCWDGKANFPAPNSPVGAPVMVPGYVASWIPYTSYQHYGLTQRPANDFAYPDSSGNCTNSQFPIQVVQLEERIHLLTYGANWGDPSSCSGDTGLNWNSIDNAENSTVQSPDRDATADGSTTSDATVQISTGVWGPFKCQSVNAPNPKAGATTLSFACSNGGDPNCKIPLSTPQTCAGGTCYVGAYQPNLTKPFYGWETLHADYWQTWQEASGNNGNLDNVLTNTPPTDGVAGDIGTFGDVVEDCTSGAAGSGKCTPAFIVSSQNSPTQVYGNGSGAP